MPTQNAIRIKTPSGWRDIAVQGAQGIQGATGATGPQGATGAQGPPGPTIDATTTTKGVVQLAGDLAGTAASPQIAAGAVTDTEVAAANKDGVAATPSLRTLGTGAQQAASGTDSRFTNARTPTAHKATHEPGGSDAMTVDAAAGTGSLRTLGTGALQAAAGNDPRFGAASAAVVLLGTGAPGAALGVDGQGYLDYASGRVYGPKAAGAWPASPFARLVTDAMTYDQLAKGN